MGKDLHLRIPVPCHEGWNNMTPVQDGKFCNSCQKLVVDFTSMSDQEIIRYFQNVKGNTCGRFRDEQLNRDFETPRKKLNWYKYFFQVMIPAFLVTSKSYSQGEIKSKPTICISPTNKTNDARIVLGASIVRDPVVIDGIVIDKEKNAIPYATIILKGTKQGVAADGNGRFSIKLTSPPPFTLMVSCVGFSAEEVYIKSAPAEPINIFMKTPSITEGVIVVSSSRRKRKPNIYSQFKRAISDSLRISAPRLYPNPLPIGSLLTIEYAIKKGGQYSVEVFDLAGRLIQVERFEASIGHIQKQIQLNQGIAAGTYILNLLGPDNKRISTQKLIAKL